jgi:hypothetical protein
VLDAATVDRAITAIAGTIAISGGIAVRSHLLALLGEVP